MFENRYLTRGVQARIPLALQIFLWDCIDHLPEPKDYLQVFRLSICREMQNVIHEQEQPKFKREYLLNLPHPITAKIYVIDDGDHCTMLLAEEY